MAKDDHEAKMRAELVRQLETFGIEEARISVAYQADWQDYDVLIAGPELDDQQIAGIRQATKMGGCVRFTNRKSTARLLEAQTRDGRELLKAMAAELRKQHPDLPSFDPATTTLSDFAKSLEIWAGLKPGSALKVYGNNGVRVGFGDQTPSFALVSKLMDSLAVFAETDTEVMVTSRSEI